MFVFLPQIACGNMALIFSSHFHGYNKNEIFADCWDHRQHSIGMHRMFLNVATFSVTNRSISSTKKKIFFQTFLPDILMNTYLTTYYYVVPRILGHPVFQILRALGTTSVA
jgi:hypothetical protein